MPSRLPLALSRRRLLQLGLAGGVLLAAGCAGPGGSPGPTGTPPHTPATPRAPKPVSADGLTMLASQRGDQLLLHTSGGDLTYWAGVNLGSTIPGHSPGELAMRREDYQRWFPMMRDLGVRVVRIYTIHPPAFYEELRAFNLAHPDDPLYLVQGIYLPDESYLESHDLFAKGPTDAMIAEVRDTSGAVHGDLTRPQQRGRAWGTWTADVSPWTAAWLVGVEWDPLASFHSDRTNAAAPAVAGRYFATTPAATPTERWVAARMEELASYEAARGVSVPIGLVNWPTTDPLRHPEEPLEREDMLSVDANHVLPTAAWPAGTFASYHAYPYYPDFQLLQPSYAGADPYRAYLLDLKAHHAQMPLLITELGVPGSLGSAHNGSNGRHQGDHDEAEQQRMHADLVRLCHEIGLGGAWLFAWADEWFKFTWNTVPRHAAAHPERRALWHDPLTNEQWFGILANDPNPVGRRVVHEAASGLREVALDHDASFLTLTLTLDGRPSRVELGFAVLPGPGLRLPSGAGSGRDDVAVVIDVGGGNAEAFVRGAVDPILLDGLPPQSLPTPGADGWSLQRLTLNRPFPGRGASPARPAELMEIGRLKRGDWSGDGPDVDSRRTWRVVDRAEGSGIELTVRLPWSMLLLADPSSLTAYDPSSGKPAAVPITGIEATAVVDGASLAFPIRWEGWNAASYTERPKRGIGTLREELRRHE